MKNKRRGIFSARILANIAVVGFGILLYFAFLHISGLKAAFDRLLGILSPFLLGTVIAFLLGIPTRFFERKLFSRLRHKRVLSILAAYMSTLIVLALLLWLILPQVIESIVTLLGNAGSYLDNLNELMDWIGRQFAIEADSVDQFLLSYEDLLNQILAMARDLLPNILNISMRIGSGIVSILTAVIASIYMLSGKEQLLHQCRRGLYALCPPRAADIVVRIQKLSLSVFTNFISGKLLDSACIGIICFVLMSLMDWLFIDMPFTLLISVIVGVTNIIPFFGPFIGAIPSAMILLIVNPMSALWFTVMIIVLQQFDGNILGPKILGSSTGLSALWVLAAIIVGGGLFGFIGMLAGVPVVAVLHTLFSELIDTRLRARGLGAKDGDMVPDGENGKPLIFSPDAKDLEPHESIGERDNEEARR
ncbi:MAG: AI-2E family transporter [Clostridiales bacterium]|jgi:predicted PurR-regulated permease PerM|nr:AI-2E family transporter [Clostridiales bacterium]